MRYWPNPAHKRETTEAGPPRWRPHKSPCPSMTREERATLLEISVPVDPADRRSRRYAVRRHEGRLELFEAQYGEERDGEAVFHGYPWYHADYRPNPRPVPYDVLVAFRGRGDITESEFKQALRNRLFR